MSSHSQKWGDSPSSHPVNLGRCDSLMFSGTENTANESSGQPADSLLQSPARRQEPDHPCPPVPGSLQSAFLESRACGSFSVRGNPPVTFFRGHDTYAKEESLASFSFIWESLGISDELLEDSVCINKEESKRGW